MRQLFVHQPPLALPNFPDILLAIRLHPVGAEQVNPECDRAAAVAPRDGGLEIATILCRRGAGGVSFCRFQPRRSDGSHSLNNLLVLSTIVVL